jgi:hypothetical protein
VRKADCVIDKRAVKAAIESGTEIPGGCLARGRNVGYAYERCSNPLWHSVGADRPPGKAATRSVYRRWVRFFPCAVCQVSFGIDSCHTGPHGLSEKASDLTCIPPYRRHHRIGADALHRIGRAKFERVHGLNIGDPVKQLMSCTRGPEENGAYVS